MLVLFAGLAVLARELPECMALTDDVSNDGNVPASLQEELVRRVSHSSTGGSEFFASSSERSGSAAPQLGTEPPVISSTLGRALLPLFQIQRK